MDNAGTSFPKPPCVHEAMASFAASSQPSPSQVDHITALARAGLAELLNAPPEAGICFTSSATVAMERIIQQLTNPGDYIITAEHEPSPLSHLIDSATAASQCRHMPIACDPVTGQVDLEALAAAITPATRLVALTHAHGWGGNLRDLGPVVHQCRSHQVPLLVDASHTVGRLPVDLQADAVDIHVFAGHKSLLGPPGTAGIILRPGVDTLLSRTANDKSTHSDPASALFELDTPDPANIAGLNAAVRWILDRGVSNLWNHERSLMRAMIEGLSEEASIPGLRYLGPQGVKHRIGIFTIEIDGQPDLQPIAKRLETEFGILAKAQNNQLRFSFGPFLRSQDVKYLTDALSQI